MLPNNTTNISLQKEDFDKIYKELKKEMKLKKKVERLLKKYPLPKTKH